MAINGNQLAVSVCISYLLVHSANYSFLLLSLFLLVFSHRTNLATWFTMTSLINCLQRALINGFYRYLVVSVAMPSLEMFKFSTARFTPYPTSAFFGRTQPLIKRWAINKRAVSDQAVSWNGHNPEDRYGNAGWCAEQRDCQLGYNFVESNIHRSLPKSTCLLLCLSKAGFREVYCAYPTTICVIIKGTSIF